VLVVGLHELSPRPALTQPTGFAKRSDLDRREVLRARTILPVPARPSYGSAEIALSDMSAVWVIRCAADAEEGRGAPACRRRRGPGRTLAAPSGRSSPPCRARDRARQTRVSSSSSTAWTRTGASGESPGSRDLVEVLVLPRRGGRTRACRQPARNDQRRTTSRGVVASAGRQGRDRAAVDERGVPVRVLHRVGVQG